MCQVLMSRKKTVSKKQIYLCNINYNLKSGGIWVSIIDLTLDTETTSLSSVEQPGRLLLHTFRLLYFGCFTSLWELESWLVNIWCSQSPKVLKEHDFPSQELRQLSWQKRLLKNDLSIYRKILLKDVKILFHKSYLTDIFIEKNKISWK